MSKRAKWSLVALAVIAGLVTGGWFIKRSRQGDPKLWGSAKVVPGEGIGPVKLGMTESELIALLGQPKISQGTARTWKSPPLTAVVGKEPDPKVMVILAGVMGEPDSDLVRDFAFKTPEGIGMLSTEPQLLAAFGDPEHRVEQPHHAKPGVKIQTLSWYKRGIQLSLTDGKVTWIHLRKFKSPESQPAPPK